MPFINSPYYEQLYVQLQSAARVFPNSGGTWTSSGAQLVRAMTNSVNMNPSEAWINAQWKHGSRSQLPKIKGRKSASWSMNVPLAPSGTPGTVPDCDPVLQSIFGGPATIAAGVSATYNIYDQGAIPFGMFDFTKGSTITGNRYSLGCLPKDVTITFNGDLLEIQTSGDSVACVQSEEFPVTDATAKGGLTTFPVAPGTFSTVGQIIPGFGGLLTLDGAQIIQQCDEFSMRFSTGFGYKGDFVDDAYPAQIVKTLRAVSVTIGMVNNDSAALVNLKQKARTGQLINGSFVLGTLSGYIVTVSFNGLQLNPSQMSEQGGYFKCSFGEAQGTVSPGYANETSLTFS